MKKQHSVFLIFVLAAFTFGQQALWTTLENDELKCIPYNSVIEEVLEFYDLYEYYFDYTGYKSEKIMEIFFDYSNFEEEEYNLDNLNLENGIDENVAFACKIPKEGGSAIIVLCIDKNNFDMVVFSNVYDYGANNTYYGERENDRKRFQKWFKTLLD